MYVPYNQIEIDVIQTLGGTIQDFYPTLEELQLEHGSCDYTLMKISGVKLDLSFEELDDTYDWLSFEDIKES